jgi:hypothetical protein
VKTRTKLALASVLALSLTFNGYLIMREPVPRARLVNADSRRVAPRPRPVGLVPSDIDPSLPCQQQLAEVEARLVELRPEHRKVLTPKERFDEATANPAGETEFRPLLEEMFADAPDDFDYELECRDLVCRVTVRLGTSPYPWLERVQNSEYRSRWQSMMFLSGEAYLVKRDPS